jgi:hypothetical protein
MKSFMSQIEIKRVFSLANVLTILRHSHLQVKNLDQILIVVKTWLVIKKTLHI